MAVIGNKSQPSMVPLPTSYSLTNSSLESNQSNISDHEVVIGEQWIVLAKIGEGSFGEVFEVKDINTGRHYAVKREPRSSHPSQIKHESILYDILAAGPGIPQCHWYGRHEDFECIVMDLLGSSLKHLRQSVRHIPLPVVMDFGCQMVDILEHIHNRGLLYRDVKPENFLFSGSCRLPDYDRYVEDKNTHHQYDYESCEQLFATWGETRPKLFVVDLGLATCWRNLNTKQPYPENKKRIRNKTGTARYASLNVHRGKTPSRRDDMESLGYLVVDLALGGLPWTGIQARSSKAGWDRMHAMKEEIRTVDLCGGLPRGIMAFIDYTRHLGFADEPDYQLLRQLLQSSSSYVQDGASLSSSSLLVSSSTLAAVGTVGNKAKNGHQQHHSKKQRSKSMEATMNNTAHFNSNGAGNNQEDIFIMDDLVTDISTMSLNKKPQFTISQASAGQSGGGRRRRNSKRSTKPAPSVGQRQQHGPTQTPSSSSISRSLTQNGKQQQQQRQRYQPPHHHHYHHHRPFPSSPPDTPSTSESKHQQQQHGLADPWSRYPTATFNQNYQHTQWHHGGTSLV